MAVLLKKRLINPGRRRMTAKQKLFFGTKRQRAAVSRRLSNKSTSKRRHNSGKRRVKNVGEIITLSLPKKRSTLEVIKNPMPARRRVARTRRRRNAPNTWSSLYQNYYNPVGSTGARRRRSRSAAYRGRRGNSSRAKLANPRSRRRSVRVVTRYRYRNPAKLANPRTRRRYYRRSVRRYRNPGFLSSDIAKVAGILGGATLTNLIAKQIPTKYTTGTLGYASLTAIAFGQGYIVKRFLRNQVLGEDMMIGGLVLVAMKLMSDLFPSISLPFSLAGGLGLIGNSSFTVPQVPIAGSMGRFQIAPNYQSAINAAVPVTRTMNGINQSVTMGGRTGSRRVGRIN